jgi:RHS repeat-associated protein
LPSIDDILYYHRNQQYSITAVSDGGGTVVERYAYSAYGKVTIADGTGTQISNSGISNRYSYTGREWDDGLSLYHYRARMYDAVAGRFVSRDPIGFAGGLNLYALLDSTVGMDPSGMSSCKTHFKKLELDQGWHTDEARKLKKLTSLLKDKLPCSLKLQMSGQYESRVCTKCCSNSTNGEHGNEAAYGAAGIKASCSPSAAIGHWPEISGSIEMRVSINRSWDTCVPRDESKICVHANGEFKLAYCIGAKANGNEGKVCVSVIIRCNGGYCTGPGQDGPDGGCDIRVRTEGCLKLGPFGGCIGKNYPIL